jgi:hypothetical protein
LLSVFPYPAIPEVGTGRPASVGGFYPFVPGGLPISLILFDVLHYVVHLQTVTDLKVSLVV